ncbi:unnamed protein product, partial [Ectocarpus sp. 13 AM-2016]
RRGNHVKKRAALVTTGEHFSLALLLRSSWVHGLGETREKQARRERSRYPPHEAIAGEDLAQGKRGGYLLLQPCDKRGGYTLVGLWVESLPRGVALPTHATTTVRRETWATYRDDARGLNLNATRVSHLCLSPRSVVCVSLSLCPLVCLFRPSSVSTLHSEVSWVDDSPSF